MNDLPRQKLAEILQKYGPLICDEPSRLKGFLLDFCGQYRKEVNVLIAALQERVPGDLLSSQNSVRSALLIPQLVRRLQDNLGLDEQAARWSVESWALALDVISPADLKPPTSSPEQSPTQPPPLPPQAVEPPAERPPIVPPPYRQENIFVPTPTPTPPPIAVNPTINPTINPTVSPPPPAPLVNPPVQYAGFWVRFAASMIDGIIVNIVASLPIALVSSVIRSLYITTTGTTEETEGIDILTNLILGIVIGWLYFALQESSAKQATLGKRAMGIVVTDLEGKRISFGKASGRHFGKIVSSFTFLIGFIMAAFTEKRQALHDMMAGTLVFKRS